MGSGLFGKSVTRAMAPLALLAGAAWLGQKAWAGLRSAVRGAAALEQSGGAIETVFKGSAPQVLDWTGSASTAVGLIKNEALRGTSGRFISRSSRRVARGSCPRRACITQQAQHLD